MLASHIESSLPHGGAGRLDSRGGAEPVGRGAQWKRNLSRRVQAGQRKAIGGSFRRRPLPEQEPLPRPTVKSLVPREEMHFSGEKAAAIYGQGVNVGFRAGSADGGEEVWKAALRIHGFGKPGMIADRS